jgi:hypothetical protein
MLDFSTISDVNLLAFKNNGRSQDVIAKKQEILDSIAQYHNLTASSILFVGFSSFVMANTSKKISITCISNDVKEYLTKQKVNFEYVPEIELINHRKQFDVVVAVDEYFTYSDSDQGQKDLVGQICSLATDYVITTLRDYKNQDYKEREFSQPSVVRDHAGSTVFLESHSWSQKDRNSWASTIYVIDQQKRTMETYGEFARRTMYFKQLANFSAVAGAMDFTVYKNLMYKGLIKKNYEHVITITFN